MNNELCYECGGKRDRPGFRFCKACNDAYVGKNGYIRETIFSQQPSNDASSIFTEIKNNARSQANASLKRGEIVKNDCEVCKNPNSQMHHPDYGSPTIVVWLCRACHLYLHNFK